MKEIELNSSGLIDSIKEISYVFLKPTHFALKNKALLNSN